MIAAVKINAKVYLILARAAMPISVALTRAVSPASPVLGARGIPMTGFSALRIK